MRPILAVIFFVSVALTSGCGNSPQRSAGPPLSDRERDSVLAQSGLPGAATVGRALQVNDGAAARGAVLDSIAP